MLFGLLGSVRSILAAISGGAVAAAAMLLFYEGVPLGPLRNIPVLGSALELVADGRVDRERKAALAGYVAKAELVAINARLAVEQRRREAAEIALAGYSKRYAEELAAAEAENERLEQGIADHEKKLADGGRACILDDADVRWLRNVGRQAPSGGN